jgi:hypothetical protein
MADGKTTDSKAYIHYVYHQIQNAGTRFVNEGISYQRALGLFGDKGGAQIPSGGNSLVDHAMANVMSMTYDLHQLISHAMQEHGHKMQLAVSQMNEAEQKNVDAIYNLLGGGASNLTVSSYPLPTDGTNPDYLGAKGYAPGVKESAFRPMPKSFAALPDPHLPFLAPVQSDLVGGDPHGLTQLADALTRYVLDSGNQTFNTLKNTVEGLVKDDDDYDGYHAGSSGGWVGPAAYSFRNAYITDAATMNGLHCTMCKTAGILNDFASDLTSAEKGVEQVLYSRQSQVESVVYSTTGQGTLPNYLGWFSAERVEGGQRLSADAPGVDKSLTNILRTECRPYFDEAEAARHKAASRLAGMGELLLSGIQYYQSHSSNITDGVGALITTDEYKQATNSHGKHTANLDTLTKNLLDYQSQLNLKPSDTKAIMNDLNTLGVNATSAASVLGAVKDYKGAQGALGKGKGIASVIGSLLPLIAQIGLGIAAA